MNNFVYLLDHITHQFCLFSNKHVTSMCIQRNISSKHIKQQLFLWALLLCHSKCLDPYQCYYCMFVIQRSTSCAF